ncbi:hypothetical protein ABPG75_010038 [Micractinium tetrahymenae]
MFSPPPTAWADVGPARQPSPARPLPGAAASPDQLSQAWKHLRNVVQSEGRSPDLHDLLSHSVRETQYSFSPQGWPSLVRPLSPVISEMPGMVLERYNACQTVAFCGVFPEIKRAWASVDNSLFLWRFDKWQDVPIEYSGEEQAIVAVGLARPKPGVFVEAIQHLLVLCTTTEIVLLGVCCSRGPGGTGDECEELALQPLPLYSVPADNVTMVCVASTADGRIFLGGADGHLYELQYSSSSGWRNKRCQKVCHTGGLRQLLPSFLPSFLFGLPSALVDICIDDQRRILYTRSQASVLQVFDLGSDGSAAPAKVAESSEFLHDAARALGGRDVFGRGGGDRKGAAVVYMAPIPPSQSHRLHLLTVTADGRRVYWSAASSRYGSDPAGPRPDRLRAEVARQAMPSSAAAGGAAGRVGLGGAGGHAPARGLEVVAAHYSNGVLLLAEAAAGESRTRLFMLSRDLTIPPVGTATGTHVAVAGLREAVSQLEVPTPGEACAIRSVPRSAPLLLGGLEIAVRDELTTQNLGAAPRFVMVTTAGVLELEKMRPVDVLAQLLEQRDAAKLEVFFKSYGAAEAAGMCILLATAGPPQVSAAVVSQAKAALDNPRLCGEPQLRDTADGGVAAAPVFGAGADDGLASGFDMGAVVPVAEPEWSGAHHGLCLYASRVLQAVWDEQVVASMRGSPLLKCKLPLEALQSLEDKLRALDAFLADYLHRRRGRLPGSAGGDAGAGALPAAKRQRLEDAQQAELKRTEAVRALVARAAEACFLLRVLSEHNIGRLAVRMEEGFRSQLRALRFREWVSSEDGEAVATQLISVLVAEHLSATGGVAEDLAAALQQGCGSYFKEDDKLYYQASGLLQRAEAAAATADREALAREAVALMLRVPLAVDLAQVVPQLAYLRAVQAIVDLPLRKAAALDPHDVASQPGPEGEAAAQRRDEVCYQPAMAVLRLLIDRRAAAPALEALGKSLGDAERAAFRQQLLAHAAASPDPCWHASLYRTLVQLSAVKELLSLDTPYLEAYLIRAGGLLGAASGASVGPLSASQVAHVEVLARFYISRHEYAKAAQVYELLADRASGPGEQAVSLEQREEYYQAAVLQAKSYGDAELLDRLESKARIMQLQQRLVGVLAAAAAATPDEAAREEAEGAVSELRAAPKPLEVLYNDFAIPSQNWRLCLEMVHLANFSDRQYVCQLWDLTLKEAWQQQWEAGGEAAAAVGAGDDAAVAAALDESCQVVESLGEQFYPNENSFPTAHMLMRLEQAAAGSWPLHTGVAQDSGRVLQAMAAACKGSYDAVVRVYEALLSVRGGDEAGDALHAPALRLRLLRSLATAIAAAKDKLLDRAPGAFGGYRGGRREAGLLAAACEAYAAEARRLLPAAEAERLSAQFEVLQAELQPLLGGFRPVAY